MKKKPAAKLAKRASAYRTGTGKKSVAKESFELPVPYSPSKPVVPMPPEITLPAPSPPVLLHLASESIRKKKQLPLAFSSILLSAAISGIATAILYLAFGLSPALALPIFIALLICISIAVYSTLENRARTGKFQA